jgi:hypothetical protein
MDAVEQFKQKVLTLAAAQGDIDVPIAEQPGSSRGTFLDVATEILEPRGYRLYKVRVDGATWLASYRDGANPMRTSTSGSST